MLLLLLACADDPVVGGDDRVPPPDSDAPPDSGDAPWPDPILRVADVVVDNEGMELTDAVRAGDRLLLLGQQQQARGGAWLFELSDPDAPGFLGRTDLWHIQSGCFDGQLAWGVDRFSALRSLDISGDAPVLLHTEAIGGPDGDVDCDPGRVVWGRGRAGGTAALTAEGRPTSAWRLDAETLGVRLDGEVLWTSGVGALYAWRWSGEGPPELARTVALEGACRDIALGEALLAVACGAGGVHLLRRDVDDPALLGTWRGPWSARAVGLDGDTLLVAGWAELLAVDVSAPEIPRLIGAEAASSAVMGLAPGEDGRVYVADWRTPFVARVVGGEAPELRLSPEVPAPGERVAVLNDGTAPLRLHGVSHGALSGEEVPPGGSVLWTLPDDLAPGDRIAIRSDDPDEPEVERVVADLGSLTVGEPAPEFLAFTLEGEPVTLDVVRGEVTFLGLFADG